ncbi:hypothetical protein [Micromonospora sp. DT47]|uniref:hypothetical protein n=1 Tax=Micromonospora sp. DT47 TaxID=3393431 RepID=UPI003CF304C1
MTQRHVQQYASSPVASARRATDRSSTASSTTSGSPPVKLQELGYSLPVSELAFNPVDNSLAVATAAASIAVHDPRSGIELARILHPKPARSFAFSADGVLVATTSDDNIVRVWTTGT